MSDDPDFLFALKLQQQLDGDISDSEPSSAPVSNNAIRFATQARKKRNN